MKKKISTYRKNKALKFAMYEWEMRNGDWYELENEPDWTLTDQVKREGLDKYWISNPASQLATMIYDGLFYHYSRKQLEDAIKFFGKNLWLETSKCLARRDHDT